MHMPPVITLDDLAAGGYQCRMDLAIPKIHDFPLQRRLSPERSQPVQDIGGVGCADLQESA